MSGLIAPSYTTFFTANGECSIAWNDKGIANLLLPTNYPADVERWRKRRVPEARRDTPDERVTAVIDAATRYFEGVFVDFSEVPVDLSGQSEFFTQIYRALRLVKYGETTTYGALARNLGAGPGMARDVGAAMATNPVPLIIPCHRVLAAGGKVGGFSAPGGATSKIRMLRLEGVEVSEPKPGKPAPSAQGGFKF